MYVYHLLSQESAKLSTFLSLIDEDDENEYKAHRKAVHENLQEMKEYYGAVSLLDNKNVIAMM